MPIVIHDNEQNVRLTEEAFKDEAELQACLERSPYLLISDSESPVATVQREVRLPSAGILDLLVVDKEGVPIAVEVKLSKNAQSRREVIAQAFDYVADLSTLSFEELDDIVDGALTGALDELCDAEQNTALRKQCATNLRAGRIRLVIAVDTANQDLVRIVRYIVDHSDIDVRLVFISQFDKGRIVVPRIIVSSPTEAVASIKRSSKAREIDPVFAAIIEAYDSSTDGQWQTRGNGRTYRTIYPDNWADGIHYEFLHYPDQNGVGIELHLETDEVRKFASFLIMKSGQQLIPGLTLEWDPRWSRQRGRLKAIVGKDQSPELAVQGMKELISQTRDIVEKNLQLKKSVNSL